MAQYFRTKKRNRISTARIARAVFALGLALPVNTYADTGPLASVVLGEDGVEKTGFDVRGWLSQGFTWNPTSSSSYNGPVSFNDRADEYQMNQLYLVGERVAESSGSEFDLGGRVDLLYGTDSSFTTSAGWDNKFTPDSTSRFYKFAIPQAYLEANLPLLEGVSVKAGHFYTNIGYEVVTAPDNFFYSHAYTMQYGEPFTHWGATASTKFFDGSLVTTAGWVKGWDNMHQPDDGDAALGGLSYTPWDGTTVNLTGITGNEVGGTDRSLYSLVLIQKLTDQITYILQHDKGSQDLDGDSKASWYGINQYLMYKLTDKVSPGLRFEWFRDDDGVRVAGVRSGAGGIRGAYYAATAGVNFLPCQYLTLRPEVRYDWQDGQSGSPKVFDRGEDSSQLLVAMDAIIKF